MPRRGRPARFPNGTPSLVLLVVALVPLLVLLARAGFQAWNPVGDNALIALHTGDVGTSHTPLIGPYSRFDWSHPGPLLYYLLALPYRLIGNEGLLVGSLVINGVAVVVYLRTLLRLAGTAAAVLGVTLVGFAMFSLGTSSLWSPWNPTITLLPFAAFVAVTWSVTLGWWQDVPWLVALGSLLVQSHIGYAPLVLGLGVVAAIGLWWSRREVGTPVTTDTTTRDPRRRSLIISGALLVILWIPPAIDAAIHDGGNFGDLISYWTGGTTTIGAVRALRLMALALSLRAPWLGFDAPTGINGNEVHGWPVPVALVLLVVACVVAFRRHDRVARNLCVVVLAAIVIGVVAVSNIVGDPLFYLVNWTKIVAAMTWFAAAWTLARALPEPARERTRNLALPAAIAFGAAVLVIMTVSSARADVPDGTMSRALGTLIPKVRHELVGKPRPVGVDGSDSFWTSYYRPGLLLALHQAGIDVTAPVRDEKYYGSHVANGATPATSVSVVPSVLGIEARLEQGGDLIARSGRLEPLPADAPPRRPGEDIGDYLKRLNDTDQDALVRILHWWGDPVPVGVFRGTFPR